MSAFLSEAEQDEILRSRIGLSLDNFSLAWRVADLLIEYAEAGLPPPRATISLLGGGRSVEIAGANCGLFTTPVIQMAVLDTRRTIEFFGVARDSKADEFKAITKRQDDDLGIEHFGLPLVNPQRLLDVVTGAVGSPAQPLLLDMHRWSSKHLAHFTVSDASVTLQTIRDSSKAMIEAYLVLLFDPLGRQRPRIQPLESDHDPRRLRSYFSLPLVDERPNHATALMKKIASVGIATLVVGVLWWWNHAPEIQWHEAKSYVGKKVTVAGPVMGGRLDSPEGTVMMIMGIGRIQSPNRDTPNKDVAERNGHTEWESSLHILMPRANLARGWSQKDLERGTVMKWTGTVRMDLGTTWLNVDGDWQSVARWYEQHATE